MMYLRETHLNRTLDEVIREYGLVSQPIGTKGAIQVLDTTAAARWDLHHLTDYIVSSSVSGPSLILVPC